MRSFRTLILSLAVHIFLAWLLTRLPPLDLKPHPQRETVQWMDTSRLSPEELAKEKALFEQNSYVRKADPPAEILTEEKKHARFSSEDEQNVIEERKARNFGLTMNRSHQVTRPMPPNPPRAKQAKSDLLKSEAKNEKIGKTSKFDLNPKTPLQDAISKELAESRKPLLGSGSQDIHVGGLLAANGGHTANANSRKSIRDIPQSEPVPLDLPNFMGAENGSSTISGALPDDIKFGDFTALNTDRNLFYSFYSRLEEVIRPAWVRYARAALYSYESGARKLTGRETWTTKIEALLDKNGNYVRSIIHEGSGIVTLDEAPVDAFRVSRQFPHPPPEMVKDDGMIHIYYVFTVSVAPQYADGE